MPFTYFHLDYDQRTRAAKSRVGLTLLSTAPDQTIYFPIFLSIRFISVQFSLSFVLIKKSKQMSIR